MLTPSSNTVLEPMTTAILAGLPDVTAHFSRFPVTEIALSDKALGQFDTSPMLAAAKLLADAKVGTICWNGTSAGWLGFQADEELARSIEQTTGIVACSSVLSINEIFRLTSARTFGLVTPYTGDVQEAIVATYRQAGWECISERHLGISVNFDFSEVTEHDVAQICREVAAAKPDAILVFCTNMRGAAVAPQIEAEFGIPVYDTVSTAVWGAMRTVGKPTSDVKGWGRLFEITG